MLKVCVLYSNCETVCKCCTPSSFIITTTKGAFCSAGLKGLEKSLPDQEFLYRKLHCSIALSYKIAASNPFDRYSKSKGCVVLV